MYHYKTIKVGRQTGWTEWMLANWTIEENVLNIWKMEKGKNRVICSYAPGAWLTVSVMEFE